MPDATHVAAARLGANTVLIQNRPVLGGNASTEILVPPVGVWPHAKRDPLDPREAFCDKSARRGRPRGRCSEAARAGA